MDRHFPAALLTLLIFCSAPAAAQTYPTTPGSSAASLDPYASRLGPALRLERPEREPGTANPAAGTRTSRKASPAGWGTTLAGLTIVLLMIVTAAFLLRKKIPAAAGLLPTDAVQLLGRRFIDQRHCIQIVRLGSRILVLGTSAQHGIRTLTEITDPVEVDLIAGLCRQGDTNSVSMNFARIFQSQHGASAPPDWTPPRNAKPSAADYSSPPASHEEDLLAAVRERLDA